MESSTANISLGNTNHIIQFHGISSQKRNFQKVYGRKLVRLLLNKCAMLLEDNIPDAPRIEPVAFMSTETQVVYPPSYLVYHAKALVGHELSLVFKNSPELQQLKDQVKQFQEANATRRDSLSSDSSDSSPLLAPTAPLPHPHPIQTPNKPHGQPDLNWLKNMSSPESSFTVLPVTSSSSPAQALGVSPATTSSSFASSSPSVSATVTIRKLGWTSSDVVDDPFYPRLPLRVLTAEGEELRFTAQHLDTLRLHVQALGNISLTKVCSVFSEHAHQERFTQVELKQCLTDLVSDLSSEDETRLVCVAFQRLFDLHDRTGEGWVWSFEFVSSLACVVDGTSERKLKALFRLFDTNSNNKLTCGELTQYIKHVFMAAFAIGGMFHSYNSRKAIHSAAEVASSTAGEFCFRAAMRLSGQADPRLQELLLKNQHPSDRDQLSEHWWRAWVYRLTVPLNEVFSEPMTIGYKLLKLIHEQL